MPKAPKVAFYAVRRGRKQGVYESWEEAKVHVLGCPDAKYRKFAQYDDAFAFAFPKASQQAPSSTPKPTFYGVRRGNAPGVYQSWEETQKHIAGCVDVKFRIFWLYEEAYEFAFPGQTPPSSAVSSRESGQVSSLVHDALWGCLLSIVALALVGWLGSCQTWRLELRY
jgi:viroplasmin and RNaseH domain-containing protein